MIWDKYVEWAVSVGEEVEQEDAVFSETALHVYKRYCKYAPEARDALIQYLIDVQKLDEAFCVYEDIISNHTSKISKSQAQYEVELAQFISKFPESCLKLKKSPVDLFRSLLEKYKDSESGELGQIWIYFAEFFIRQGQFELARDIFEESLDT